MNRHAWVRGCLGSVVGLLVGVTAVCADEVVAVVSVHNDGTAPLYNPAVRAVVPFKKGFYHSLGDLRLVALGIAPLAATESYIQTQKVTTWDDGSLHSVEVIFQPAVVLGSLSATAAVISQFQIVQKTSAPAKPAFTLTPEVTKLVGDSNGLYAVLVDALDNIYFAPLTHAAEITKAGPLLTEAIVNADLTPIPVEGITPAGPALYHAGMVRLYVNVKKDTNYLDGWLEFMNGYVDEHPNDKLYFKRFGVCSRYGFIPFIKNKEETAAKEPFLAESNPSHGDVWCQELIPQPADGTVNLLRDNGVVIFKISFAHEKVSTQALNFLTHEPLGIASKGGVSSWQTVGYGPVRAHLPMLPSNYTFSDAVNNLNGYYTNFLNDTTGYPQEGYLKMSDSKYGGMTGTAGLSPIQDPTIFAVMTAYHPMIDMLMRVNVRKMQRMFSQFYHPDGKQWNYNEQTQTDSSGKKYNLVKMTLGSLPNFYDPYAPDFNRKHLDSAVTAQEAYVAAHGLTPTNEASYLGWNTYDYQHLFRMSGINDAAELWNETIFKDEACQISTMARALVTELPKKANANPAHPSDGYYNSLWMISLADVAAYGPHTGVKDSGRGMSESLFWVAACHEYTRDPVQKADLEQYAHVAIAAMGQSQINVGDNGSLFIAPAYDKHLNGDYPYVQTWEDAIGSWMLAAFYGSFGNAADPADASLKTSIMNIMVRTAASANTPMFFDFNTYDPPRPWGATALAPLENMYAPFSALVETETGKNEGQYHRLPFQMYTLVTGNSWYVDTIMKLTDFTMPVTKFFSYWSGPSVGWTFSDWSKQQGLPVIDY